MPAMLPSWLRASNAPQIYAANMPEAFKLGMQSDQFGREMALKGADQQNQMLRAGTELGLQSQSQANAMAMNVANLRWQQEEQAQRMQLAWQQEADQMARAQATLDQQAYQHEMDSAVKRQQLQQEMQLKMHGLEIGDQYRKAQIGLAYDRMGQAQQQFQVKTEQAAKEYQLRRQMSDIATNLMEEQGLEPQEALQRAMAMVAPKMEAGAWSSMFRQQKPAALPPEPLPGYPGAYWNRNSGAAYFPGSRSNPVLTPNEKAMTLRERIKQIEAKSIRERTPEDEQNLKDYKKMLDDMVRGRSYRIVSITTEPTGEADVGEITAADQEEE